MSKPTIVTRATKGSALTWAEGDANITNLQTASPPNAGTTGQVLRKTSNTNWDMSWSTIIDDNSTTSTTSGWSASKLNATLGDISSALSAIQGT
jgi:cellobiose phosphorylase